MTPQDLRARIANLPADTPRHKALERALAEGEGFGKAWYQWQKEHWQGWLGEYDGPGAYGRKNWTNRDAAFIWNHIQCAPMLFWLAEALGLPDADLDRAYQDILAAPKRYASQCAALRRVFPWKVIEAALPPAPPKGPMAKLKAIVSRICRGGLPFRQTAPVPKTELRHWSGYRKKHLILTVPVDGSAGMAVEKLGKRALAPQKAALCLQSPRI